MYFEAPIRGTMRSYFAGMVLTSNSTMKVGLRWLIDSSIFVAWQPQWIPSVGVTIYSKWRSTPCDPNKCQESTTLKNDGHDRSYRLDVWAGVSWDLFIWLYSQCICHGIWRCPEHLKISFIGQDPAQWALAQWFFKDAVPFRRGREKLAEMRKEMRGWG